MRLSPTEFADKGEDTKTGEVISKIQESKVRLGLAYRRLQWRNFLSFFSQLQEAFRLFDNANCPNLQNKPKMFFIQACRGGECPNTESHVLGMPLRLILHSSTPSHSTCCQLSSLLLSGVSGTHIHLPLPCCCHYICCSVSVFSSAWGVCIDLQTPEHLSDIKLFVISHSYLEASSCCACSRGSGAHDAQIAAQHGAIHWHWNLSELLSFSWSSMCCVSCDCLLSCQLVPIILGVLSLSFTLACFHPQMTFPCTLFHIFLLNSYMLLYRTHFMILTDLFFFCALCAFLFFNSAMPFTSFCS